VLSIKKITKRASDQQIVKNYTCKETKAIFYAMQKQESQQEHLLLETQNKRLSLKRKNI
jgi:hypothetical protein